MSYRLFDYETCSWLNLRATTHSLYATHPSTEILLCASASATGEVRLTPGLHPILPDETAISWGAFDEAVYRAKERGGHERFFDLMQVALYLGLPASLDGCATALGLEHRKDPRGERLIRFFCQPRSDGKFNDPTEHRDDWIAFGEYAAQDVIVLRDLFAELKPFVREWRETQGANHALVKRMNARGVPIDRASVRRAVELVESAKPALIAECEALTGGISPTQVGALTNWLGVPDLRKTNVQEWVLDTERFTPEQRRVMELRLKVNYPSVRKLPRMLEMAGSDDRIRDQFWNNGAHTGRLTSLGVQLHNMKAAKLTPGFFDLLDVAPELIDDPIEAVATNMRGFIQAPAGRQLLVSDYSQIECRVLAWLADEEKLLRAFRVGHDVYRMMAANIVGKPLQTIEKGSPERQIGKVVVLGCGYQLGPVGLVRNAKVQWGLVLDSKLAERAVWSFRTTFDAITRLWDSFDLAMRVLANRQQLEVEVADRIRFAWSGDMKWVEVTLPSGRKLRYREPWTEKVKLKRKVRNEDGTVVEVEWKAEQICFKSRSGSQLVKDWTYGGKLTENIVQAIAADIMLHGMHTAERQGFELIASVHDEVVAEIDENDATEATVKQFNAALCALPEWALGIPIVAEGWTDTRYHK